MAVETEMNFTVAFNALQSDGELDGDSSKQTYLESGPSKSTGGQSNLVDSWHMLLRNSSEPLVSRQWSPAPNLTSTQAAMPHGCEVCGPPRHILQEEEHAKQQWLYICPDPFEAKTKSDECSFLG